MLQSISPPDYNSLNDYYKSYWKYLKDDNLLLVLFEQQQKTSAWLGTLSPEVENIIYAPGKWMLKEVVGHLCDTERILSYRALRFARNDKTELPSFDENSFMANSNFKDRTLTEISEEWKSVRFASMTMFASMNDELLDRKGSANSVTITPRILLYFIIAHERHHLEIIRERYLKTAISA